MNETPRRGEVSLSRVNISILKLKKLKNLPHEKLDNPATAREVSPFSATLSGKESSLLAALTFLYQIFEN